MPQYRGLGVEEGIRTLYRPSRPLLSRKEVDADLRDAQRVGNIAALPILGGLHHQYVRV
jgi:hypothetical protein